MAPRSSTCIVALARGTLLGVVAVRVVDPMDLQRRARATLRVYDPARFHEARLPSISVVLDCRGQPMSLRSGITRSTSTPRRAAVRMKRRLETAGRVVDVPGAGIPDPSVHDADSPDVDIYAGELSLLRLADLVRRKLSPPLLLAARSIKSSCRRLPREAAIVVPVAISFASPRPGTRSAAILRSR